MARRNRLLLGFAALLILGELGVAAGVVRAAVPPVEMASLVPDTLVRSAPRDGAPEVARLSPGTHVFGFTPRFWSSREWIELQRPRGYTRGPLALEPVASRQMFATAFAGAVERSGPGPGFQISGRLPYGRAAEVAALGNQSVVGPAPALEQWAIVVRGGAIEGYVSHRELAQVRPEFSSALGATVVRLREGRYRDGLGIAVAAAAASGDEDAPRLEKLRDALAGAAARVPFPEERPQGTVDASAVGRPYGPRGAGDAFGPGFVASAFASLLPPQPARAGPVAWLPLNTRLEVLETRDAMARVALPPPPRTTILVADAAAARPDAPSILATWAAEVPSHAAAEKGGLISGRVALGALAAAPIDADAVLAAVNRNGARDRAATFAVADALGSGALGIARARFGAAADRRDDLEMAYAALTLAGQGSALGPYHVDGLEVRALCAPEEKPSPECTRAQPEAFGGRRAVPGTYLHARLRSTGSVSGVVLTIYASAARGACAYDEAAPGDPDLARLQMPPTDPGASLDLWVRLPADRIREAGLVSGFAQEVPPVIAQHLGRMPESGPPPPGQLRTVFLPGCGLSR